MCELPVKVSGAKWVFSLPKSLKLLITQTPPDCSDHANIIVQTCLQSDQETLAYTSHFLHYCTNSLNCRTWSLAGRASLITCFTPASTAFGKGINYIKPRNCHYVVSCQYRVFVLNHFGGMKVGNCHALSLAGQEHSSDLFKSQVLRTEVLHPLQFPCLSK